MYIINIRQSVQSPSINHGQCGISRHYVLLTSPGAPWSWHQTLVHVYTVIPASVTSRPRRTKDHSKYYSAVIIITEDILTKMTEEYLLAWNDHHATFFSAMSDLVTGGVFICRYSKTL